MYKILVLEDNQFRIDNFRRNFLNINCENITFTKTATDAIDQLNNEVFDLVFLDHDLGDKIMVSSDYHNTGAEVSRWLKNNSAKFKECFFVIHSLNPAGAKYMYKNLKDSSLAVIQIPFVWEPTIFERLIKFEKQSNTTPSKSVIQEKSN